MTTIAEYTYLYIPQVLCNAEAMISVQAQGCSQDGPDSSLQSVQWVFFVRHLCMIHLSPGLWLLWLFLCEQCAYTCIQSC